MYKYFSNFFFLSLFVSVALTSLSLSPHSPWSTSHHYRTKNSIDQHHTTAADQHQTTHHLIKSPPITLPSISVFLIWSRSNHYHRSTSNHCHTKPDQIAAGLLSDFSLFDQWVSGWVGDDLAFELSGFRPKWVSDLGLIWSRMVF